MRFFFTLVVLYIGLQPVFSQRDSIRQARFDSLNAELKADSAHTFRFKKFRPYANLDNRSSFIHDKPVNVNGLQLGLIYNERHVFCLGFYTITEGSKKPRKISNDNAHANAQGALSLRYATLAYQFALLDKRFFEVDLPFELGLGSYNLKVQDLDTKTIYKDKTAHMVPLGAGAQLVLKPVRWVGFSTMVGYRYVAQKDENLNFNGWYYSLGVWIDVRQIYRDIKYYGFIKKKYKKAKKAIELAF